MVFCIERRKKREKKKKRDIQLLVVIKKKKGKKIIFINNCKHINQICRVCIYECIYYEDSRVISTQSSGQSPNS